MWQPADLGNLCFRRRARRNRISSYDIKGGNADFVIIAPGESRVLCDMKGAGCITHIWTTIGYDETQSSHVPRKAVLRMYWDEEASPSVEAPIGDFFGMGHGITRNFVSEPLQMSPEDGRGFNCWFPMPFETGARIVVENQNHENIFLFYYIDYEELDLLPPDTLRFHAQWRRQCPTDGVDESTVDKDYFVAGGENITGDGNYVILEAEGAGHYVGCNLNIDNRRPGTEADWPGEGDDMIFIDGEKWPPRLHGTGTEDYVCTAWGPRQEYNAPYHGIILGGEKNWKGQMTYYRYHVKDPVIFESSIRVTLEHGHDNHRSDDFSSTAYWYQTEPHKPFEELPAMQARLPLPKE